MSEEHRDLQSFITANGGWLLSFFGVLATCIGGLTTYFLKSRCSKIKLCCGMIDCVRIPIELEPKDMEIISDPQPQLQSSTVS